MEKEAPEKKEEDVVYHEAGHAVAACFTRMRFKQVTILPDKDSLGKCSLTLWKDFRPDVEMAHRLNPRVRAYTFVALAGVTAEEKSAGHFPRFGFEDDQNLAYSLISKVVGSFEEEQAYVDFMRQQTKNLIEANWEAAQAVAQALLERKTLRYPEVRRLIMQALKVEVIAPVDLL